MRNIVILGAGAAGLSAAWELAKHPDVHVTILERENRVGGIAITERLGGSYIDVGGHRFFSKKPELVALMREMGERDSLLRTRRRTQRIIYRGKYLSYPISLNPKLVRDLGVPTVAAIAFSWLGAVLAPKPETSLENFYINRFGRHLYDLFFRSYTEKVCGMPPTAISPEWGHDRVRGLSIRSILCPKRAEVPEGGMPPDEFLYPPHGPGQLWDSVAEQLRDAGVEICLNTELTGFRRDAEGGIAAVLTGEREYPADYCISTIPVRTLVQLLGDAPAEIADTAAGLTTRGFLTAAMLVPRGAVREAASDCWVYVQEPDVKMGRFQIYNNWSPELVEREAENVLLGFEYFSNPGDGIWEKSEKALCSLALSEAKRVGILLPDAEPIAVKRCCLPDAYPTYGGSYWQRDRVYDWLGAVGNLRCAGRQGLHSYINMDAVMESGIHAAKECAARTEKTIPQ